MSTLSIKVEELEAKLGNARLPQDEGSAPRDEAVGAPSPVWKEHGTKKTSVPTEEVSLTASDLDSQWESCKLFGLYIGTTLKSLSCFGPGC